MLRKTMISMAFASQFSGATYGLMVGHLAPEAYVGGPLAVVHEGDSIVLDIDNRGLNVEFSDEAIRDRLAEWTRPEPRYTSGVLAKYAALVSQADQGAVTRPLV